MVPPFEEFLSNSLAFFVDGQPHSKQELLEYCIRTLHLTDEDCKVMTKKGSRTQLEDRVTWAIHYLKKAGLLTIFEKGKKLYIITDEIKYFNELYPNGFTRKDLDYYTFYYKEWYKTPFAERFKRIEGVKLPKQLIDSISKKTEILESLCRETIGKIITDIYGPHPSDRNNDDFPREEEWSREEEEWPQDVYDILVRNSYKTIINNEKDHSRFIHAFTTSSLSSYLDKEDMLKLKNNIDALRHDVKTVNERIPVTHFMHAITKWSGIRTASVVSSVFLLVSFLGIAKKCAKA